METQVYIFSMRCQQNVKICEDIKRSIPFGDEFCLKDAELKLTYLSTYLWVSYDNSETLGQAANNFTVLACLSVKTPAQPPTTLCNRRGSDV